MCFAKRYASSIRTAAMALAIAALSGCAIPGHYLGVVPPSDDPEEDVQDVGTRADVFRISATSVDQLVQRQAAASASVVRAQRRVEGTQQGYRYLVGAYDLLRITVWNHPELTNPTGASEVQTGQEVNGNGTFFYPFVGEMRAAGLTVGQIRDALTRKLARFIAEPQVDVSVMAFRSQRAFAMGQLAKPGMAPITEVPMRVSDLVAHSGGLTDRADLGAAVLTRGGSQLKLDLYALYYKGDLSQDVLISPGDILTVPENRYNKVFVLGEVVRPQSIVLPRGRMSLAEALADAGGVNPFTANTAHLYVIRGGTGSRPEIWYLNARSPDALVLADRFDLRPRDVVYVDPAGVARFGRVLNNILPSASLLRSTLQQP
ncbi:outer membrane protein involved in polysaccharide [Bordetella ansorpii]|uniref:Outer membrane protein involved in polysaccharide n=1 Tax=Bordetella ansorpii TaxID=288768 RepID=A0A146AWB5_9BORD|nr:polysaccharide biosynthesis/export family protein [Bordetella ansorpii]CZZ94120.1 outer membrane protein involved in polysaccharide [Bordetella ansorpii]